jgi:uncharacterized protein (UPF0262 family)
MDWFEALALPGQIVCGIGTFSTLFFIVKVVLMFIGIGMDTDGMDALDADVDGLDAMDGVDAVAGATSFNHVEDEIMCKMISQAKQKYLIVDDFKIGREVFAHIADLTAFDGIITNYLPRLEEHYQAIRDLGVEVIFGEE